jgi:hypothetical protein
VITSPELQQVDQDAARVCRGYAIEGECAYVVRTTGNTVRPIRIIGPARDAKTIAAFLREAANAIDRGADIEIAP